MITMHWFTPEEYSETSQTSKMECFAKIVNDEKFLTIFPKRSVSDVCDSF